MKKRTKKLLFHEGFPAPPFEGFTEDALWFFRELAQQQNKAWFEEHKDLYERAVRGPMANLVVDLSQRLIETGLPLRGDPKRSLFRLNRDVRFSADKAPYKTNAGCFLTRTSEKMAPGLLYFHLGAQASFTAAGFYRPEPDALHRMRLGVVREPKAWKNIIEGLAAQNLQLSDDDVLVRIPRGFEAAPAELHEALKLKSWVVRRDIPLPDLHQPSLVNILLDHARASSALLEFGWAALDRLD